MSMNFSFDHLARITQTNPSRRDDAPLRILYLADLTGRDNRAQLDPISSRRPHRTDPAELDDLMRALNPRLALDAGTDGAIALGFHELDDLLPDALCQKVESLRTLLATRRRLRDPKSFDDAAREVRSWTGIPPASEVTPKDPGNAPAQSAIDFASLLAGHRTESPKSPAAADVDALIRKLIAPHIIPDAAPDQPALVQIVERALAAHLRDLLRHDAFRGLENAWRALHLLVTSVETDESLSIDVLDVSRREIEADLAAADPSTSGLYDLLVRRTVERPGGTPWTVLCLNLTFDHTPADATLAAKLAAIARACGSIAIAGATPAHLGCRGFDVQPDPKTWQTDDASDAALAWRALRESPFAAHLALALPRVLMRTPFGEGLEEIDTFPFEELEHDHVPHDHLPWMNPSVLPTVLLAQAFADHGWDAPAGVAGDVGSLPFVVRKVAGEREAMPVAECWLTDTASNRIADAGYVPITSIQHRDAARVGPVVALDSRGVSLGPR